MKTAVLSTTLNTDRSIVRPARSLQRERFVARPPFDGDRPEVRNPLIIIKGALRT